MYTDNVKRMEQFRERHPGVSILLPRQNETGEFLATWQHDPGDEHSAIERVQHRDLGPLMDILEERFGR